MSASGAAAVFFFISREFIIFAAETGLTSQTCKINQLQEIFLQTFSLERISILINSAERVMNFLFSVLVLVLVDNRKRTD